MALSIAVLDLLSSYTSLVSLPTALETFLIEGKFFLIAIVIPVIRAPTATSPATMKATGLAFQAAFSLSTANFNLFVATVFAPFATVSAVVAAASFAVAAACFFLRAMLSF